MIVAIVYLNPHSQYFFLKFVLTATGSDADDLVTSPRKQWLGAGLGRVPIFCAADYVS